MELAVINFLTIWASHIVYPWLAAGRPNWNSTCNVWYHIVLNLTFSQWDGLQSKQENQLSTYDCWFPCCYWTARKTLYTLNHDMFFWSLRFILLVLKGDVCVCANCSKSSLTKCCFSLVIWSRNCKWWMGLYFNLICDPSWGNEVLIKENHFVWMKPVESVFELCARTLLWFCSHGLVISNKCIYLSP